MLLRPGIGSPICLRSFVLQRGCRSFVAPKAMAVPRRPSSIGPNIGANIGTNTIDSRPVFFFDIDNCLYPSSANVHGEMTVLINRFFATHLELAPQEASLLHQRYYREYGLAIEGLTRHHKIDPLQFNREVDDALPLDKLLRPDPMLRALLEDIDRSKVKLWLLTNAYINHARRVVRLLGVEDLFDGVTYCDYSRLPLVCKPSQEMFEKAEIEAGAPSTSSCYFVDDSHLNCTHAQRRGWTTVHLLEPKFPEPRVPASKYLIRNLKDLRIVFPQFFKRKSETIMI